MQRQPKRHRGFIAYARADEAKAKWLQRVLERYRVPRGIAFEGDGKGRKLGRFAMESDEREEFGPALKGALADSESLIAICSPKAAASDLIEKEIAFFKARAEGAPVLAVIVKGKPHVWDSPNPRNAARECFSRALTHDVDAAGVLTDQAAEPIEANLRKEGMARTRARIAAALIDAPFEDLWRRDRGRAWAKRFLFGTLALCALGGAAFVALANLGLEMRRAQAGYSANAAEPPVDLAAAKLTVIACQASVDSVRAWDAAVETGMRTKEYREMEKIGTVFKEAMYVCAATSGRRSTAQNARAVCDRLNGAIVPADAEKGSEAYAGAMEFMGEQLQTVKAACAAGTRGVK